MKWQFEISDCPDNMDFPIIGHQILDSGIKRGPFQFAVETMIEILSGESPLTYDADGSIGQEIHSHVLPLGTILYSHTEDFNRERVTMVLPKKTWDIRYGNEQELIAVEFPRLLVQYVVVNKQNKTKETVSSSIIETRLFAIEDNNKPVTADTQLYSFPFPNVGKTNGIVCWGGNACLSINSLTELERTFTWFVSAPFNEDHGVRTTLGINNFRKLVEEIKEQPFKDAWLVPLNKTLEDFFKQ